jgi:hypothetical protein
MDETQGGQEKLTRFRAGGTAARAHGCPKASQDLFTRPQGIRDRGWDPGSQERHNRLATAGTAHQTTQWIT